MKSSIGAWSVDSVLRFVPRVIVVSCLLAAFPTGSVVYGDEVTPRPGVPGRLSPLRWIGKHDTVTVGNSGYSLDIQRVFKVSAEVPQLKGEVYGEPVYAGAISMKAGDGKWITDIPTSQYSISGGQTGSWLGQAVEHVSQPTWEGTLAVNMAVGYPSLWFKMHRSLGSEPLDASLMGYDWAGRTAPLQWWVSDGVQQTSSVRTAGKSEDIPMAAASSPVYLVYRDAAGFSGCLRFSPAPASCRIDDTGVYWTYNAAVSDADVEYLTQSGDALPQSLAAYSARCASAPSTLTQKFSCDIGGRPSIQIAASGGSLVLPSALAASGGARLDTVEGSLAISPSAAINIPLPEPPQIEALTLPSVKLSPQGQKRVDAWVKSLLAHQMPNGSFDFSNQRGFYDGMVCCSLAEVWRQLPVSLQPAVKQALKRGLAHLWDGEVECGVWPGYKVAPEQTFFIQSGVDYPEITGFTLQATAIYSADIDPSYLQTRWPQITRQFDQLRTYTDWTGAAYANPGPDFYQIIPEGSIGGYLGWHALYHLSKMHHSPQLAGEAKARSAFAWQAFLSLYKWKPGFGEGIVNGINNGHMEVRNSSPWDAFQYTWFAFLPAFVLPQADTMHLWARLDKMPWWEWTGSLKSRQRANDGGNISAMLRSGYASDVFKHSAAIEARPVWFDAFDFTPTELIPTEYWLQIYQNNRASARQ